MALVAVRFPRVGGGGAVATQGVLPQGHQLQMINVRAVTDAAEVVDCQPFGDGPPGQLPRHAVHEEVALADLHLAVAVALAPGPQQAAGLRVRDEPGVDVLGHRWPHAVASRVGGLTSWLIGTPSARASHSTSSTEKATYPVSRRFRYASFHPTAVALLARA